MIHVEDVSCHAQLLTVFDQDERKSNAVIAMHFGDPGRNLERLDLTRNLYKFTCPSTARAIHSEPRQSNYTPGPSLTLIRQSKCL